MISRVLLAFILVNLTYGLNNGLGRTPQMGRINDSLSDWANDWFVGWNSWYNFGCNYNEKRIQQTVDVIVGSGLAALGYEYSLFPYLSNLWESLLVYV